MKIPAALLVAALLCGPALADEPALKKEGDRITIKEVSVKIMTLCPDSLIILSPEGVQTVKKKDLPDAIQKQIDWPAPPTAAQVEKVRQLGQEWVERKAKEDAEQLALHLARLEQENANNAAAADQAAINAKIANHEVWIGMAAGDARRSWGSPSTINRTTHSSGTSEQWVYSNAANPHSRYLYFENGVLDSMQD